MKPAIDSARAWIFPAARSVLECDRRRIIMLAALILFAALGARADGLTDAEVQGRALAGRLATQQPTKNYTASGTLELRDGNDQKTTFSLRIDTVVTATNWESVYQAGNADHLFCLAIVHTPDRPDVCYYRTNAPAPRLRAPVSSPSGPMAPAGKMMTPFAGSDFWIADLGLEFFHWPGQKLLRKETKRSRSCSVLESMNPSPAGGAYARVVSWIDNETGGIVQARAYDADNRELKEFYPKDFKKVNGQWQVGMMEMDNDQTGSRSRIEFDLKSADSSSMTK